MELVNRSAIPVNIRIIVEYAIKRIESINPYFVNWIASIYSKIFQYRLETM
jgi:hypothetical protein